MLEEQLTGCVRCTILGLSCCSVVCNSACGHLFEDQVACRCALLGRARRRGRSAYCSCQFLIVKGTACVAVELHWQLVFNTTLVVLVLTLLAVCCRGFEGCLLSTRRISVPASSSGLVSLSGWTILGHCRICGQCMAAGQSCRCYSGHCYVHAPALTFSAVTCVKTP